MLDQLSIARRIRVISYLTKLARDYLKMDFDKAEKEDLKNAVKAIDDNKDYSVYSRQGYRSIIKKFYRWLEYGDEYNDPDKRSDFPSQVSWISGCIKEGKLPRVSASDILTENEIIKILEIASDDVRNEAIIATLYEDGCRIGEHGGVRLKHVKKDGDFYVINEASFEKPAFWATIGPMNEIKNIETLNQLKEINFYYYVGLKQAKEKGTRIAYLNALGPIEFSYAFDALPAYPENHSVVVQAKRLALDTAQAAEAKGWTPDICSYARCDLGYRLSGKSPIGGIPTPDLLVYSSAQCFTLFKWFEELSRMYQVPLFVLDVPGQGRGLRAEPEKFAVLYVKEQLYNLIQWLEDKLGQKFDVGRFRETVRLSNEAARLFYLVLLAAREVPAPLTLFDQYLAMAPIVDQRGKEITVKFYRALVEELKDRIAQGIEGVPGEKYRFWWDGLPLWMAMRDFYNILMERKINLVANNYTRAWCQLSFEPKDDLDAMLEQYAVNLVRSFDPMIRERSFDLAFAIKEFQLNGYLLHSDHSCRFLSLGLMDTLKKVTAMTGLPGLLLDTDHGDPRLYSSELMRNRLDAYLEMLKPIER